MRSRLLFPLIGALVGVVLQQVLVWATGGDCHT